MEFDIFKSSEEREILYNSLFIEYISKWTKRYEKSETYSKLIQFVAFVNLNYLGYYRLTANNETLNDKVLKSASIFNNIFTNKTFCLQMVDLCTTLNMFLPKRFIDRKKKKLMLSIINYYSKNIKDATNRKIVISNFESLMDRYDFLWILFVVKYYKLYIE